MKNLIYLTLLFPIVSYAQNQVANCSSPTASIDLDINAVRARINQGGNMFWDKLNSLGYEVPKGNNTHAILNLSLLAGGIDASGQVKTSAFIFNQGDSYWSGTVNTNTGLPTSEICNYYDQLYKINKADVVTFVKWYQAGLHDKENGTNTQQTEFPNYQIPSSILSWPAQGRNIAPFFEPEYLAPFYDFNEDGIYNPLDGDYPKFNLNHTNDCNTPEADYLMGDQTIWRVFNDKGNQSTEFVGMSPGMEYRVQSYGYLTGDELDYFTFHQYTAINRSTHTLNNFRIGFFNIPQLGNPADNYVGCDVSRGLVFTYNSDNNDETSGNAIGYGLPPAIGIVMYQGLWQDADGKDNLISDDSTLWKNENATAYTTNSFGYQDGVVDNERLGLMHMQVIGDGVRDYPSTINEVYYYLQSKWRDGTHMVFGGSGYIGDANTNKNIKAKMMYIGNSDPKFYSTEGKNPNSLWTEETSGNSPYFRNFITSSGPVTMLPGQVNSFTIGLPFAQENLGYSTASVAKLKHVSDKTQAMFNQCFIPMAPPDAPELVIREYDKSLIIQIYNSAISNNYQESFAQNDPFNVLPDSVYTTGGWVKPTAFQKNQYNLFTFQGYKLYQVQDTSVSIKDLNDSLKARLIWQADIKDDIVDLFNLEAFQNGEIAIIKKVSANNKGIDKAIKIEKDFFTNKNLINHKTYYYLAVAYAANPNSNKPYLQSVALPNGKAKPFAAIPHKVQQRNEGTLAMAQFGDSPNITRLEGIGNSGQTILFNDETVDKIVNPPYKVENPTYKKGFAPIDVSVIDPLNVKPGEYFVKFLNADTAKDLSFASLQVYGAQLNDTLNFTTPIKKGNQIILPEIGIGITANYQHLPGTSNSEKNGFVSANILFPGGEQWLTGVQDKDGITYQNWILSGKTASEDYLKSGFNQSDFDDWDWYINSGLNVRKDLDGNEDFEKILDGTWAPFRLAADHSFGPVPTYNWQKKINQRSILFNSLDATINKNLNQLNYLHSVQIVFTPNKSLWTRVPVIEMADTNAEGGVQRGRLRIAASLDKNGNPAPAGATPSTNPDNANYIAATGMSWFPGYAIDLETGERLNMAFGEASNLIKENGRDMIWNPTSSIFEGPLNDVRFGGLHYILVFRNNIVEENKYSITNTYNDPKNRFPAYDAGKYMVEELQKNTLQSLSNVYRAGMWVSLPLIHQNYSFKTMAEGLVPAEAIVQINVVTSFQKFSGKESLNHSNNLQIGQQYLVTAGPIKHDTSTYVRGDVFTAVNNTITPLEADSVNLVAPVQNKGKPWYSFSLTDLAPIQQNAFAQYLAVDDIQVVPNPYYTTTSFQAGEPVNEIKITNLPQNTEVKIYTINGQHLNTLKSTADLPYLLWDGANLDGNAVAPGVYIFHISTESGHEKIIKWVKAGM